MNFSGVSLHSPEIGVCQPKVYGVEAVRWKLQRILLPKSCEDLVLCAASAEGLNSENGNLLPETGNTVQPHQQTV